MPNKEEQFWQQFTALPQNVQDAMLAMDTAEAIRKTAEREAVLPMVSTLAKVTGDVMLGITPITSFRETIQRELAIDEEKARRIAQAIRGKIFTGIADSLRKIHNLQ